MSKTSLSPEQWRPGQQFFKDHVLIPLVIIGFALVLLEHSGVDLWLADRWFAWEGEQWSLRHHWLTYDVIHHHGKQFIILLGLSLLGAFAASWRVSRLRLWRWPLGYALVCMTVLPATIAYLKKINTVACPWDLARYGGEQVYLHNFEHELIQYTGGGCFPSGHASGGYALLALYFAALAYTRNAWLLLLPGLLIGTVFALGQQARGAHFLSHDLWTLAICWFGSVLLFLIMRPYRDARAKQ